MPLPKETTTVEAFGRYQAYETRYDESGVVSDTTDLSWETKNFAEARRLARALDAEHDALVARYGS